MVNRVMAFMYDDYYCYGIESSYKGIYDSVQDALLELHGGTNDNQNIEIINIETKEFQKYGWRCLFRIETIDGSLFLVNTPPNNCQTPIDPIPVGELDARGECVNVSLKNMQLSGYWTREYYE